MIYNINFSTYRLKDNLPLEDTLRFRTFSDEAGHAKLVVKDLVASDAGLYFCVAANKAGKSKTAATIRVVGKDDMLHMVVKFLHAGKFYTSVPPSVYRSPTTLNIKETFLHYFLKISKKCFLGIV